jgi:hypothetical protein
MTAHDNAHDDFSFEPIPGLPAVPPRGEILLWQGRPDTLSLARQAFGLDWVAAYFVALIVWRASVGYDVAGLRGALAYGLPNVGFLVLGCGVVLALAWAQARTTVYTITTARVAMRIGAALSVTLNLPFTQIGSANLALGRRGTGTIALELMGETRLSYLVCWPHVRPYVVSRTQPALRCIPDAERVARLLAEAAETRLNQPIISRADAPIGNVMAAE